jgi:hypothetical protein
MGESFLIQKLIQAGGSVNYVDYVVQDENSAKYVVYNGYDYVTNPTPDLNNLTFNQWLLNNSASGNVILNNTIMTSNSYNGPNPTFNEANLAFSLNSVLVPVAWRVRDIKINNGFVYTISNSVTGIRVFHENNLTISLEAASGASNSLAINNGFLYQAAGETVIKRHESNLVSVNTSASQSTTIFSIAVNNGFVYAGSIRNSTADVNGIIRKYLESNLATNVSSIATGTIYNLVVNNGNIFAGNETGALKKFRESNLQFLSEVNTNFSYVNNLGTNNGFIYVSGNSISRGIEKYRESNLQFIGNIANIEFTSESGTITFKNNHIYVAGNNQIHKYRESNLAFVGNTPTVNTIIMASHINNGFIYVGGAEGLNRIRRYQTEQTIQNAQTYYTITDVKEE